MTFGLWNRKSSRDESKPLATTVSKSKWASLKGKLSPRRDQQPPDTKPPVNTKNSAKDRPREPRSGAVSSSAPIEPVPRSTGWPSRLRDKAARGLHLRGKLSSKNETKKQPSPRPLSSESYPEWDPEYYASTMEAERRAVAERLKPAVTIKKEEPKCEDADDDDSKVVLPPLPLRMTQNARDVVEGGKTTSARPPVPPGAPDPLEAPSKSLDGPLNNVTSGDSSHRQTSQLPLRTGPSIPPGKGATPSATLDPIPYIVIEEATPRSLRTRRPQCVYQPPGFPTLQFDTDGRCVVAEKSQGVTLEKGEPEPPSDRAESPEVFLPPLPAPLRPPNPCNVVKNARRTTIQSPTRQRAPKSSNVSPTPSAGKIEGPLEAPSRSLDGPLNNGASGDSSHRQTSQPPLRTCPSTPPGKGSTPRATPDPIPYIVIEEATPKSVRTRRPQCVYQPPGFPTLQFDTDDRCVVAKSQGVTLKKEEPEPVSDRAESPEVFLPPLPAPLRPPNPCNVVKNAERTTTHSSPRHRAPNSYNVSPTPSAGKIEATESTCSRASPSGRVHLPSLSDLDPKPSKVSEASPKTESKPSGLLGRENISVRSAASEVHPVLNDGHKRSESCRSGDSGRSDETIKASKVGFPRGPGVATVQQPTPSGHSPAPGIGRKGTLERRSTNRPCIEHLRPPIASSRRPQKPELVRPHHVPAVPETDRGREPTAHSNGLSSRQVGLSAKVIWARQLKYRLDFCATVGDRVKYAAAAQDALKAGYVICPNHVLRRASAIIPMDAALFPFDSALLADSSSHC